MQNVQNPMLVRLGAHTALDHDAKHWAVHVSASNEGDFLTAQDVALHSVGNGAWVLLATHVMLYRDHCPRL